MLPPAPHLPGSHRADRRCFIYRVDAQDRILSANDEWFAFARENGARELDHSTVIGQSLLGFLCNTETQHLFDILLKKVRVTGDTVSLSYRCDSPDCRRCMELELVPKRDAEVEFRSRIVQQEFREPVRMLEEVERSDELLKMCGWCKKIAMPDKRWVEVEEAVDALNLFAAVRVPKISHGICEECHSALLKELTSKPAG